MQIDHLDHLVLTVSDIEASCAFYLRTLNMEVLVYGADRRALRFGNQKLNLHEVGSTITPRAKEPTPGSADLCFITSTPIEQVIEHLGDVAVPIELGPVTRVGARGPIVSVYFRDLDGNLLEISNHIPSPA